MTCRLTVKNVSWSNFPQKEKRMHVISQKINLEMTTAAINQNAAIHLNTELTFIHHSCVINLLLAILFCTQRQCWVLFHCWPCFFVWRNDSQARLEITSDYDSDYLVKGAEAFTVAAAPDILMEIFQLEYMSKIQ